MVQNGKFSAGIAHLVCHASTKTGAMLVNKNAKSGMDTHSRRLLAALKIEYIFSLLACNPGTVFDSEIASHGPHTFYMQLR